MTIPDVPSADKSPERVAPNKSVEPDQTIRQQPGANRFDTYMQKGAAPGGAEGTNAPTPMDLARTQMPQAGAPTYNSLIAQAKTAQDTLGSVHEQLNTPNLKLKRSQAHLLRNKLTDAQERSRSVAAKLGVETPKMKMPSQGGALERFMAYINDGQDQFVSIQEKLKKMAASGKNINPGDMLLLQSQMNLAQQEIEYSSTLLSRVVSSITTVLGIQL